MFDTTNRSQSFLSPPTNKSVWQIESPELLSRIKNEKKTVYHLGKKIANYLSIVYEILSEAKDKPKVIKCDICELSNEYEIVNYLYKDTTTLPTGIVLPFKGFIKIEPNNGLLSSFLIMPKYDCSLESWYPSTIDHALEALIQITKGLIYLNQKEVFHGDLYLRNIFHRNYKGKNRYDIADYGCGAIISNYKSKASIIKFLSSKFCIPFCEIQHIEMISSEEDVKQEFIKLLFQRDMCKFYEIIEEICKRCKRQKSFAEFSEKEKKLFVYSQMLIENLKNDAKMENLETILQNLEQMI